MIKKTVKNKDDEDMNKSGKRKVSGINKSQINKNSMLMSDDRFDASNGKNRSNVKIWSQILDVSKKNEIDLINSSNVKILNAKQEKILINTYNFYKKHFELLTDKEYQTVKTIMDESFIAIGSGNIRKAVNNLTQLYNISHRKGFIPPEINYPGPHDFSNLSDGITQESVSGTYTI